MIDAIGGSSAAYRTAFHDEVDEVPHEPTPQPTPQPTTTPTPPATSQGPEGVATPRPSPGPSPTPPSTAAPVSSPWAPEDEAKVQADIKGALDRHHGDVALAFADLRDQRQLPQNYYDTNMAIAADYLRARWDTQRCGPTVSSSEVETYMALKRTVGVPQEGPGPVSPYSDLELKYMRKGVSDETDKMSFWDQVWWASPPGVALGLLRAGRGEDGKEG
jgi:hypothetical protein